MRSLQRHHSTFVLLLLALLLPPSGAFAQAAATGGSAFKRKVIEAHRHEVTVSSTVAVGKRFAQWQESNDILHRNADIRGQGLTVEQIIAYDVLGQHTPDLTVRWDDRKTPIFIEGQPLQRSHSTLAAGNPHHATVRAFLAAFSPLLGMQAGDETVVLSSDRRDETGRTHLRYQQLRDGIPIHGKEMVFGIRPNGDLDLFMGRIVPDVLPGVGSFELQSDDAIAAARHAIDGRSAGETPSLPPFLLEGDGVATAERCWYDEGARLRAAYNVELHPNLLERWQVMVDAADGSVIRAFNAVCADGPQKATATDLHGTQQTIDTYLHQGSNYLIDASRAMFVAAGSVFPDRTFGTITTLNANNSDLQLVAHFQSADNTWADASSVSAHHHAGIVYEYFRGTHGRNSIDDNGSSILSIVNVTSGGAGMDNAFWNGRLMAYGNGNQFFTPLAKALDIAAHEMTHGVTEHSAGLEYIGQSGALNEAFSDIFAAMVDRDDWQLAEDVTKTSEEFPGGAMRSMEDPHNSASPGKAGWQPKHMDEYQNLPESVDNGGVHVNSGIVNHSAYLLAQQIGREKAERIFYHALTTKLTRQSQFIDYRLAIIRSAQELYGSAEADACATACDAVGITDGTGSDRPDDWSPVEGIDRMLFTNTDPSFPAPLWIAVPPATGDQDFRSVSFTGVWSRPSISDDGSVAVFVSDAFNIHAISLVGDPNEQVLDNSGIWNSIALSRDQNRLAVTTISLNPQIYIIDLSGPAPVAKSFEVITPNYTDDPVPNAARFVDAMEFALDGERLLFDTYNEFEVGGSSYGFWDINIMDVWDRTADAYGSGHMERIFPQDPGMNLGNPTFAKTKPTVIAFDAQFPLDGEAFVYALDFLDGEPKPVAQLPGNTVGFPNYSATDGLLSFVYSDQTLDVIYNVSMREDGVTASGNPQGFIAGGIWPLWFRSGQRPVSVSPPPAAAEGVLLDQNYPNPFNPSTTLRYELAAGSTVTLTVHDALGRHVATLVDGWRDAGSHLAIWNGRATAGMLMPSGTLMPSGIYFARIQANGSVRTRPMHLMK
ncbi:MAG: M4 family metallopeptidase [Bacteroidetes bacterium]|nr:M4 family metallopeptidase [Bacteroidota bacterium]